MIPPTDAVLNRISQEFTYEDLVVATGSFSASSRLGEGSYGAVFHGTLRDGTEVAIKALASPKEGGFREEVEVLSRFRHPNLVILMGFARHGTERYLVYELLPGGDINSRLNKDAGFTWRARLNVVLDAALGLSHLHGSRPQVFHRDVKTQNILMDRNGTGKVADFGLACLAQPNQRSLAVSQTSGTIGYADPLYIRSGVVTEKSEVYSLGMVLLEVLTGRPPALQHASGRIEYQFEHLNGELRRLFPMVDRRGQWPAAMVERIGGLALQCTCEHDSYRPSFVDIVTQLRCWLREEPAPGPARRRQGAVEAAFQHEHDPFMAAQAEPAAAAAPAQAAQQAQAAHREAGAGAYAQAQQHPPWPQGQAAAAVHRQSAAAAGAAARQPNPFAAGPAAAAQPRMQRSQDRRPSGEQERRHNPEWERMSGMPAAAAAHPQMGRAAAPAAAGHQAQAGVPSAGSGRAPAAAHPAHQRGAASAAGNGQLQRGAAGSPPAERSAAQAVPPPSHTGHEEEIAQLVEMGYERHQATEAFRRCSTVTAAVEWILGREW